MVLDNTNDLFVYLNDEISLTTTHMKKAPKTFCIIRPKFSHQRETFLPKKGSTCSELEILKMTIYPRNDQYPA